MSTDTAVDQLRKLTAIGRALTHTTTLEQVAELTVRRGIGLLGAESAVLMLVDEEGQLRVRAAEGVAPDRLRRFGGASMDDVTERLQGLLDVSPVGFLAVPLVAGDAVTGLVAVALARPTVEMDEWLLSALADQVAVALENARLSGEVRVDLTERLRSSEGATSSMDRALSTLAHDIRSPIGAIDGYCWNMEDGIYGAINDEQRKVLGRVRMSGRHLLSLLDNVLDMARLNAGAVAVLAEEVHLGTVAREAVHMLTPAAAAKLQTLELLGDDVLVTGDQARLRQVLVNLLGNAVKFTPDSGAITVRIVARDLVGASWGEVTVEDTGPGIAPAERAAVFDPWFRSASVAKTPGVGLGLAISHALVVQMHGTLHVESEVGVGSSFVVRMPAASG